MNIADSIMTTKSTETDEVVETTKSRKDHRLAHQHGLGVLQGYSKRAGTARQFARVQQADEKRQTKKATRNYRRNVMAALQNQQTAIGIARVYLEGAGNEHMHMNVQRHIMSMSEALARRTRPEVFADDTLSPENQFAAEKAAVDEANAQITARLREVLDATR